MDLRGVVGREEVEILRERALMFLAAARDDLGGWEGGGVSRRAGVSAGA